MPACRKTGKGNRRLPFYELPPPNLHPPPLTRIVEHYDCLMINGADYYRFSKDPTYLCDESLDREPIFAD